MNDVVLRKLLGGFAIGSFAFGAWCFGWFNPQVPGAIAQDAAVSLEQQPLQVEPAPSEIQRHTINLTVTDMAQVKVEKGQCVELGQVVSDRAEERVKLETRRDQILQTLGGLSNAIMPPAPPPEPTYAVELQAIDAAKSQLAYWQAQPLPEYRFLTDDLMATMDREITEKRQAIEQQRLTAQSNLNAATALLQQAKSAYQEKLHDYQITLVRFEETALERQREILALQGDLDQLDEQLLQITVVQSPYSAKVRAVKVRSQQDRVLTVEVMLIQGDCGGQSI
jgi:hypothetical protein